VQPGAKRSEFAGRHGERLAGYFGVPRRNVTIVSGVKSRAKRVAIEGAPEWKMPGS
jgi:uncharacterized protein YggU (UPF0235/DUF167 family)